MTDPVATRALYLPTVPDASFALLTAPSGDERSPTGVLFVPPFGWDDVCSYRSRRAWAQRLAAAGHVTLRLDLPGSGDSAGDPADPERLVAWTASIGVAAAWLRGAGGCDRVAAIGIGLGGLLVVDAIGRGAEIDDAVLWAAPSRGRAFVREMRAFAQLEDAALTGTGDGSAVPEGALATAGFVLSAETIADLGALDVEQITLPEPGTKRILLLERDGIAVDKRLREHLQASGVVLTEASGPGYNAMMAEPQHAQPPAEAIAYVADWLGSVESFGAEPEPESLGAERTARPAIEDRDVLELEVAGTRIRETPLTIEEPFGRLFGVLATPVDGERADICAVLLNAGAIRRIGPNRMWVEAARRWAALGVPTLRLDLEGIGESDGDANRFADVGELYVPELVDQTLGVLDVLAARELPSRFVLGGLCSGAYWAFQAAARDERVVAALLVNPRALIWHPRIEIDREARRLRKVASAGAWKRALRGQTAKGRGRRIAKALVTRAMQLPADAVERRRNRRQGGDELDHHLDRLRDGSTAVLLAFSGAEPLHDELESEGRFADAGRWPNLDLELVSGPPETHTLRPIWLQQRVHEVLDKALVAELDRAPAPRDRAAST